MVCLRNYTTHRRRKLNHLHVSSRRDSILKCLLHKDQSEEPILKLPTVHHVEQSQQIGEDYSIWQLYVKDKCHKLTPRLKTHSAQMKVHSSVTRSRCSTHLTGGTLSKITCSSLQRKIKCLIHQFVLHHLQEGKEVQKQGKKVHAISYLIDMELLTST